MAMDKTIPHDMDEYVARFPNDVQRRLTSMRLTIKKVAPKAAETISYGMPAFTLKNILVWFAAHKNHIGFYPMSSGIAAFKRELSSFKTGRGSVQFPFDDPLPLALVSRIVKFRVKEVLNKSNSKRR